MQKVFPLRSLVCKVVSRCNINCDYCYMYHHADQSWIDQPLKMSLETSAQLGNRIAEHCSKHRLSTFEVIMHGGEPLMAGIEYLKQFTQSIRENAPKIDIKFAVQTNGTLLTEKILTWFIQEKISVGLSLDGPRNVNDLHRRDHEGKSSFDKVENCLKLLSDSQGRQVWSGVLAVIDLRNDPLEVYNFFKEYRPLSIDFLLPLAHYELLPPGKTESCNSTLYADWLLKIFSTWYIEREQTISIRKFENVISMILGGRGTLEELGLEPVDFAVIETDGSIEAVDSLKVTYPQATKLGMNVFDNSFEDIFSSEKVIERQAKWNHLSPICQDCDLVKVCGGGYIPHRYSSKNQFQNPSIYCSDLKNIIHTIYRTVLKDISSKLPKKKLDSSVTTCS